MCYPGVLFMYMTSFFSSWFSFVLFLVCLFVCFPFLVVFFFVLVVFFIFCLFWNPCRMCYPWHYTLRLSFSLVFNFLYSFFLFLFCCLLCFLFSPCHFPFVLRKYLYIIWCSFFSVIFSLFLFVAYLSFFLLFLLFFYLLCFFIVIFWRFFLSVLLLSLFSCLFLFFLCFFVCFLFALSSFFFLFFSCGNDFEIPAEFVVTLALSYILLFFCLFSFVVFCFVFFSVICFMGFSSCYCSSGNTLQNSYLGVCCVYYVFFPLFFRSLSFLVCFSRSPAFVCFLWFLLLFLFHCSRTCVSVKACCTVQQRFPTFYKPRICPASKKKFCGAAPRPLIQPHGDIYIVQVHILFF